MQNSRFSRKSRKNPNNYARYSGIVFQMAVVILAGTWGGIKIDEILQLKFPVFTVVLSFVSVILAMYLVLKEFIGKK
ncbi:MAG: AtpZ/AtpI family protein [Bacteroidales bacterium]|jgi:hypothetical protein